MGTTEAHVPSQRISENPLFVFCFVLIGWLVVVLSFCSRVITYEISTLTESFCAAEKTHISKSAIIQAPFRLCFYRLDERD